MTLSHTVHYDRLFGKNLTVYGESKMIETETTYKLTLPEIKAIKLLHLLDTMCDGDLWDNDLENIYYEMKESVDTEKFNSFMEKAK